MLAVGKYSVWAVLFLAMTAVTHPRIMPGLQSCLDGVHGSVEEPVGSVSRLSFWSTVSDARPVAGVMRDVTGGRLKMVGPDLGL